MSETAAVKKPSIFSRISRFFREIRGEIKKVVWPTRKQVINNTLIVIVFVVIAAIVIGGIDTLLTTLVNLVLKNI